MIKALVLHDFDPDGLTAAVVAGSWVESFNLPVEYRRAIRYEPPPFELVDKDTSVIIVDFNYSKEDTLRLAELAFDVIVLDHHETAKKEFQDVELPDNLHIKINLKKAACRIVFEHFHPTKSIPDYILYVEDADLWNWELENSREVNAFMSSTPMFIEEWKEVVKTPISEMIERGEAITQYQNKAMGIMESQKFLMLIDGHWVPATNCADPSLVSPLGNRLAKGYPYAVTFHMLKSGEWKFSIRSIISPKNPKGVPVNIIAQKFGGGGHPKASGFKVKQLFPIKEFA